MLLPNTFDDNKFNISQKPAHLLQRHRLSSNQPIILTVARLSGEDRYKGYDKVIQSLPIIHQKIPNAHYILVGKGPDHKRIEQVINEFNVRDHVTLTGFIPDEELAEYYDLCDVFVMPSKGEGFGIVYLEAMACGKPCLGGNQDGALDALGHGELGALVNPDNIDEIAQTLIQLLQKTYPNPLLFQPEQLRQAVIERFGFEVFQHRLQQYLEAFFISSKSGRFQQ
jgi:glycosyltransferase involved in cell wall biosynthesis